MGILLIYFFVTQAGISTAAINPLKTINDVNGKHSAQVANCKPLQPSFYLVTIEWSSNYSFALHLMLHFFLKVGPLIKNAQSPYWLLKGIVNRSTIYHSSCIDSAL